MLFDNNKVASKNKATNVTFKVNYTNLKFLKSV